MAVSTRTMSRQRDYSRLIIALAVLAGVVAIAPIVAAVMGLGSPGVTTRTAFASAPSGEYAVIGRSEGSEDVISVAWAQSPGALTEVVRIPRLEGFTSTGAVSPDGKRLALVVVDAGSRVHPLASLNVVDLETGRITRAAENVVPGQSPVWAPDGAAVIATRMPAGNEAQGVIQLLRAPANGDGARVLGEYGSVLGVYPVGFDRSGTLATVVIGGAGSQLLRAGAEPLTLTSNLTRDWKLSPDGSEIAFIEVDTSFGTRFFARSVSLNGGGAEAMALTSAVSALGTAWNPAAGAATFGLEPGQASPSGVTAQALTAAGGSAAGFDVPLGYSATGGSLVVTHWTGGSFQDPGHPELQLVTPDGRGSYENYSRFYGWSAR